MPTTQDTAKTRVSSGRGIAWPRLEIRAGYARMARRTVATAVKDDETLGLAGAQGVLRHKQRATTEKFYVEQSTTAPSTVDIVHTYSRTDQQTPE